MVAYMSKTVVLTSGTSGIGKAIAKKLLSEDVYKRQLLHW